MMVATVGGAGRAPVSALASPLADNTFASTAFQSTWARTDYPVTQGQVTRSYYWGPAPNTPGLQEDYLEGAGGKRLVQYFDKSRMEVNNPNGNPDDPFFVTNGLLTEELISGRMQVGNNSYVTRPAASIPLASDTDDQNAPTYVSFQGVSNTSLGDHPVANRTGQSATTTIDRAGHVGNNPAMAGVQGTSFVYFEPTTRHNVPKIFWDYFNAKGPQYDMKSGTYFSGPLSDPWFYSTGLPISEPYWAKVKIANQPGQDVLIQAFERRVLTYVPAAPAGFQVQMGNIGQHYYQWRYTSPPPAPTTPPAPQPNPTATPTPTSPSRPASDFVGTWLNNDANTGSVAKFWISSPDAAHLTVQWFKPCNNNTLCDGGTSTAPYAGEPFNITVNNTAFALAFQDPQGTQLRATFRGNTNLAFHRTVARDYFGTWLNDNTASPTLGKLWITNNAQTMTVQWFGVSSPGFYSGKSQSFTYDVEPIRFSLDTHTYAITCDNAGCSKLSVLFDANKTYKMHQVVPGTFAGTWNNVDPHTTGITKLVISTHGNPVSVHWYSACAPTPCDHGSVSGSFATEPLVIRPDSYRFTITIENIAATKLKLVNSQAGQPDVTYYFQK
jgi:hypothetical protein